MVPTSRWLFATWVTDGSQESIAVHPVSHWWSPRVDCCWSPWVSDGPHESMAVRPMTHWWTPRVDGCSPNDSLVGPTSRLFAPESLLGPTSRWPFASWVTDRPPESILGYVSHWWAQESMALVTCVTDGPHEWIVWLALSFNPVHRHVDGKLRQTTVDTKHARSHGHFNEKETTSQILNYPQAASLAFDPPKYRLQGVSARKQNTSLDLVTQNTLENYWQNMFQLLR